MFKEKYFHDPVDDPCPYCKAAEEIGQLFPELSLLTDGEIEDVFATVESIGTSDTDFIKAGAEAQLSKNKKELGQ